MDSKPNILKDEYKLRFSEIENYRQNVWKVLCSEYFNRFVSPEDTVLDVGCGWGEFINNINAKKKYAMDLNPDTSEHLAKDVDFLQQDCATKWDIPSDSLDVVFTSNFLEHLEDKNSISSTLDEANRCLKSNGIIICLGPNIKYLNGAYWDFWDHVIPLTESSLSELLRMKDFNINLCNPRFLPYSMSATQQRPLLLLKLYLKMPFAWPLFGKQFLIVAEKQ